MDEKQLKALTDSINKNIDDLKVSIKNKVSAEDLEKKFGDVCEKLDGFVDDKGFLILPESFGKQQEQLDDISTKIKGLAEIEDTKVKSFDDQMDIALKGMFAEGGVLKNRKTGSKVGIIGEMEMKASPLITTDATDSTSGVFQDQMEPGVSSAPWRLTPIWNAIRKGTIGAGRDAIAWWEETTRGDNAQMTTEGTGHDGNGSYKTWTKQSMDVQMLMDYTKVAGTMLEDFEYIKSEIQDLLTNGIPRLRETALWDGVGTTIYLKGIETYAKTFALPANFDKVSQPNDTDVLMAAILQVNNGRIGETGDTNKKGFNPNMIMVNPGTLVNMQLVKNPDTGVYIIPPFMSANGTSVGGVRVIPNLDMTAGEFIVGDFSKAKAYMKRNMKISFHYENGTDVLQDLVLVMASMRLAGIKVSAADTYAFVSGTFAAGKVLIQETIG